jgi:hypothetical protein
MQEVHQASVGEGLQCNGQDEGGKADNGQLKWWSELR